MDLVDAIWPDDLSQVQYGPLSAWVGSILTGFSLLLGFYILLRDRRKEERSHAAAFLCWQAMAVERDSKGSYPCAIMLHNTSDIPILGARVTLRIRDAKELKQFYEGDELKRILADAPLGKKTPQVTQYPKSIETGEFIQGPIYQGVTARVGFRTDFAPQFMEAKVTFKDGSGTAWERELVSGRLKKL